MREKRTGTDLNKVVRDVLSEEAKGLVLVVGDLEGLGAKGRSDGRVDD
jgi:hypothetical protein